MHLNEIRIIDGRTPTFTDASESYKGFLLEVSPKLLSTYLMVKPQISTFECPAL